MLYPDGTRFALLSCGKQVKFEVSYDYGKCIVLPGASSDSCDADQRAARHGLAARWEIPSLGGGESIRDVKKIVSWARARPRGSRQISGRSRNRLEDKKI